MLLDRAVISLEQDRVEEAPRKWSFSPLLDQTAGRQVDTIVCSHWLSHEAIAL